MKNLGKALISIGLVLLLILPLVGFTNIQPSYEELLGYKDNGEILGVASAFSVFVEEDFGANGSDLEGRLFAGGAANIGDFQWYSTARCTAASVIAGTNLKNFDTGDRIFVIGMEGKNELNNAKVYQADLINTEKSFDYLKILSKDFANNQSVEPSFDSNWGSQVNFKGNNPDINYFTLDSNLIKSDQYFFNFDVPENSYIVVNISGKDVITYTQLYGCAISGQRISHNQDPLNSHILYNFYEAENLEIKGIGTYYGTILAPTAQSFDSMSCGAHLTGGIIAKSYLGGIEFGSQRFDYKIPKEEESSVIESSSINDVEESSIKEESSTKEEESSTIEEISTIEESSIIDNSINESSLVDREESIVDYSSSNNDYSFIKKSTIPKKSKISITKTDDDTSLIEEITTTYSISTKPVEQDKRGLMINNPTTGKKMAKNICIIGVICLIGGIILVLGDNKKL